MSIGNIIKNTFKILLSILGSLGGFIVLLIGTFLIMFGAYINANITKNSSGKVVRIIFAILSGIFWIIPIIYLACKWGTLDPFDGPYQTFSNLLKTTS